MSTNRSNSSAVITQREKNAKYIVASNLSNQFSTLLLPNQYEYTHINYVYATNTTNASPISLTSDLTATSAPKESLSLVGKVQAKVQEVESKGQAEARIQAKLAAKKAKIEAQVEAKKAKAEAKKAKAEAKKAKAEAKAEAEIFKAAKKAIASAKARAKAKAKAEAEARAKAEAEARAKAEAEARAKAEADIRAETEEEITLKDWVAIGEFQTLPDGRYGIVVSDEDEPNIDDLQVLPDGRYGIAATDKDEPVITIPAARKVDANAAAANRTKSLLSNGSLVVVESDKRETTSAVSEAALSSSTQILQSLHSPASGENVVDYSTSLSSSSSSSLSSATFLSSSSSGLSSLSSTVQVPQSLFSTQRDEPSGHSQKSPTLNQ